MKEHKGTTALGGLTGIFAVALSADLTKGQLMILFAIAIILTSIGPSLTTWVNTKKDK